MKTTIVCIRIDMLNMPKKVYSIHTLTFKLIAGIQFHNLLKAVKRNDYKQRKNTCLLSCRSKRNA